MNRRQAASQIAALFGTAFLAPAIFEACKSAEQNPLQGIALSKDQITFLDEFSDTLIPDTPDSPGAKAAKNGSEMADIIRNCYTAKDGNAFVGLLNEINKASKSAFKEDFAKLSHENKVKVLTPFDNAKEEIYVKLKELVVFTYFTSEIGMTQALRYIEVPVSYDGCMPLAKEDKAWAWSFLTY